MRLQSRFTVRRAPRFEGGGSRSCLKSPMFAESGRAALFVPRAFQAQAQSAPCPPQGVRDRRAGLAFFIFQQIQVLAQFHAPANLVLGPSVFRPFSSTRSCPKDSYVRWLFNNVVPGTTISACRPPSSRG